MCLALLVSVLDRDEGYLFYVTAGSVVAGLKGQIVQLFESHHIIGLYSFMNQVFRVSRACDLDLHHEYT